MSVRLAGTRASVTMAGVATSYTYDPSYRPRASNVGYVHFAGVSPPGTNNHSDLLVEKQLRTGGYALRTGGRGGYAKYTQTGDGFASQKFICRAH